MIFPSLLLAGYLASGLAVPTQNSMPQACFVFGEVFWSMDQTTALLSSNCPIQIRRRDRLITMMGRAWTVKVLIPEEPGLREFVYRWGQREARFDDQIVPVSSVQNAAPAEQ